MNQTYVVKAGDTLYGISNQYGVSVTELASLNGIKGDNIKVGQVLTIPLKSGTNPNNMFMYTVKKGDTIYSIARKYNTTVQEIMNLNYFTNTNLSIGQIIRIPEMYTKEEDMVMPSYSSYTVKKGDTIYSISKEFNIPINTIIADNSLDSMNLKIGQVLRLRTKQSEDKLILECFGKDYEPPESTSVNTTKYIVKKGDNLYSIAKNYNTSVSSIMSMNNLVNSNLSIGQVLNIPSNSPNSSSSITNTYIVKKGDNLYSIARKFNTAVDIIKKKNNLKSNIISIGQKLVI